MLAALVQNLGLPIWAKNCLTFHWLSTAIHNLQNMLPEKQHLSKYAN